MYFIAYTLYQQCKHIYQQAYFIDITSIFETLSFTVNQEHNFISEFCIQIFCFKSLCYLKIREKGVYCKLVVNSQLSKESNVIQFRLTSHKFRQDAGCGFQDTPKIPVQQHPILLFLWCRICRGVVVHVNELRKNLFNNLCYQN